MSTGKNVNLHCNGKCYLAKELSKTTNTDSSPLHKTKNSGQKLLDIYVLPEITEITKTENAFFSNSNFLYETAYFFCPKPIFKPPVFKLFFQILFKSQKFCICFKIIV
ncbi:hypothetical protein [Chryseobacterium formosense]|uniref:hypothetical protein n=1 Tax=Chryseobacterium formosense TaxID=236814 RepID=UPI000944756C|nr:hypothetical protein [Chryseobacterium formosense]